MQATIDAADKPKKGDNGSKKGEKKTAAKEGPSGAAKASPNKRKPPAASSTYVSKRGKQPARKRKTPTPSASEGSDSETESDIRIEENQHVRNQEEEPVRNEEGQHVRNEEPLVRNEEETTNPENPEVTVNVSDTGANTSFFTTHVSPPIFPIRKYDPEIIFGDDDDHHHDDLGGFTYSPFQIRTESENEATVTKGFLKSLHEKIENAENAAKMNREISESADICKSTTKKVDKLISETTTSMENYRTTYNNNTASANEALQNLGVMFKIEKTNLEKIRTSLQQDHASFQTSLTLQIRKLQDD
ncbi:unnamed protein product [Lactuca virosa]|uniref:Uncharacterized protein n=1 Tax=Lactuca virosa TaxID=75947 RepID=A0AAU9M2U2_9ASTR|nr:unnamed protein product [Lactuca virosa]